MRAVGLIVEYNPFHNGHEYHVRKAKEVAGADYAVAVMSGAFVQRGAPAVTDKYTRTRMALAGGCDLVVELPVRYATASAEGFAAGAVSLLSALGVGGICFGSECGDVRLLQELADVYAKEPAAYKERLAAYVKGGDSFPLARRKATLDYYGLVGVKPEKGIDLEGVLASPNDILGIEYCKALSRVAPEVEPYAIRREGKGYHERGTRKGIASASGIRADYAETGGLHVARRGMPEACFEVLRGAQGVCFPVYANDFSDMLHYAVQRHLGELEGYGDVSGELADRMRRKLERFTDWEGFAALLKTKSYTMTRINRCLTHILLGLEKRDLHEFEESGPYLRVLGFRSDASRLFKESPTPLLTKLAEGKKELKGKNREIIEEDLLAAHLYNRIVYRKFGTVCRNEYRQKIIVHG